MRILAIIDVAPNASVETVRTQLDAEIRGSWGLFEADVLREAYATSSPTRVVFVLETSDLAEAKRQLDKLPLIAAGQLHVELVELKPFVNWARLWKP